jgi:hypothetical protein
VKYLRLQVLQVVRQALPELAARDGGYALYAEGFRRLVSEGHGLMMRPLLRADAHNS